MSDERLKGPLAADGDSREPQVPDERSSKPLVALVTGASRGAGKGIALALGEAGMTVYVTGRSTTHSLGRLKHTPLPGTTHETAAEIERLGGHGIAVECDHSNDLQVKALFEEIGQRSGRWNDGDAA